MWLDPCEKICLEMMPDNTHCTFDQLKRDMVLDITYCSFYQRERELLSENDRLWCWEKTPKSQGILLIKVCVNFGFCCWDTRQRLVALL